MDQAEENRRKLNALKLSSFDWVKGLDDVWNLSAWDVPALHRRAEEEFSQELVQLLSGRGLASPPGIIVSGPGGAGKTHLLSRFCRMALLNRGTFLLADMSASGEGFLEIVLSGMARSLAARVPLLEGRTQASLAAEGALAAAGFEVPRDFPERHTRANPQKLSRDLEKIRDKLQDLWPLEAAEHSEPLRALFLLNSRDALLRRAALDWLEGKKPDPESAAASGFRGERGAPEKAVSGLSFCLSLGGRYTVLALDQMDHLSALFGVISRSGPGDPAAGHAAAARARAADFSDGLGRLTGLTRRTLAVVSCLPATWENLSSLSLNTALERYRRPPVFLSPIGSAETAARLIAARMEPACRRAGYSPPHPAWPFRPEAFQAAVGLFPRAILERCHRLVRERILAGDASEIASLDPDGRGGAAPDGGTFAAYSAPWPDDDLVEAASPPADLFRPKGLRPQAARRETPAPPAQARGPAAPSPAISLASRGSRPDAPPALMEREPGDTLLFAWNEDSSLLEYISGSLPVDLEGLSDTGPEAGGAPGPAGPRPRPPAAEVPPPPPRGAGQEAAESRGPGGREGPAGSQGPAESRAPEGTAPDTGPKAKPENPAPEGSPAGEPFAEEGAEAERDPVFAAERRFQLLFREADTEEMRDEAVEDKVWTEQLLGFLTAFAESLPKTDGPRVSAEGPPEGQDPPPYHALARAEGPGVPDGGRRLLVRALLKGNPLAFTSRLNKAMAAASPDGRDTSVRLALIRFTPKPTGESTAKAVEGFGQQGGLWLKPSEADLALLKAASELGKALPRADFLAWMRAFQPWRRLLFLAADLAWLTGETF
ncbi:MAG: hypothetical protein LBW85_05275 [Deltaproteobacteria bacterium]|jgi:hypothetical protein|nr:hypothetical protein [Deltaproteobacteria bacterium]